jgi:hypothetical protein
MHHAMQRREGSTEDLDRRYGAAINGAAVRATASNRRS